MTAGAELDAVAETQSLASSGVVHNLLDQADSLLDRAVADHRAGKMTDRNAAVVVATISELRSAADKLQRTIVKGQETLSNLVRNQ